MKNTINIVLYSILGTLCLLTLVIGIVGNRRHMSATKCTGIEVELTDSLSRQFITAQQIRDIIDKEYGGYKNVPCSDINLFEMEQILAAQGIMEQHEAFITNDAVLHIKAKQCTPVLKVCSGNDTWYMCRNGRYFRVTRDWCKDIPVMSGAVQQDNDLWMRRVCHLGEYIHDTDGLKDSVTKLSCNDKGEVSLRLAERDEVFIIGQPTGLKDKFSAIARYKNMMEGEGFAEKKYRTVNVKYDKQIVCR